MVPDRRDDGADPRRRAEYRMYPAVRLPAEPHCRQGRYQGAAPPLPGFEYRRCRLRPGRKRGQPAQPYQAHALHGKQESGKRKAAGIEINKETSRRNFS